MRKPTAHHWRTEEETEGAVVHRYELDVPTGRYTPTGIDRGPLQTTLPFPVDIDLTSLVR